MNKSIPLLLVAAPFVLTLVACESEQTQQGADVAGQQKADQAVQDAAKAVEAMADQAPEPATNESPTSTNPALAGALEAQPDEVKARYQYRHPQQTLEFFGIEPGMVVVEALPGGGWYSKILLPYLGNEGKLIGADYALDMYPKFGFFSAEALEEKKTWVSDWTAEAKSWTEGDIGADVTAFAFGSMPDDMAGTADAVIFIRALHNLSRFESDGGYLTTALADADKVLKPGGIVGVVQHEAPTTATDDWASGSRGYMKRSVLVERMNAAGFELIASSDINANPADQPGDEDIVWRLPPTLATSGEDPELREQMVAIGESNRMTLTFRKR